MIHLLNNCTHETVIRFCRPDVNLLGYIAIHNTKLGPATGGTRFLPYQNEKKAIKDVLNLSEAMSYKCALAGLPYGGGKAVIIGRKVTKPLLNAYSEVINKLGGSFTTGTDVGLMDKDIEFLKKRSPYFFGTKKLGLASTSYYAAKGVYQSILTALDFTCKNKDLNNHSIAIKGLGKLGLQLVRFIKQDYPLCKIFIADIENQKIKKAIEEFPDLVVVKPNIIHKINADIYSPCALGNEFNLVNSKKILAKIIAGGANNQLSNIKVADLFHKRKILFLPDFVINSGGLIRIVEEIDTENKTRSKIEERLGQIPKAVDRILLSSKRLNIPPLTVALQIGAKKLK